VVPWVNEEVQGVDEGHCRSDDDAAPKAVAPTPTPSAESTHRRGSPSSIDGSPLFGTHRINNGSSARWNTAYPPRSGRIAFYASVDEMG